MQHLDEGLAHAWIDGALSAGEGARIEAHVASCAECAALVASARGLAAGASRIVASLDVVPRNVVPSAARPQPQARTRSLWTTLRLTPARAALAATLMIAVASVLAVRYNTPGNHGFDASRLVAPPATRAPVVPSGASQAPSVPPSHVATTDSPPVAPRKQLVHTKPAAVSGVAPDHPDTGVVAGANPAPAPLPQTAPAMAAAAMSARRMQSVAVESAAQPAAAARFSAESLKARDAGPGGMNPRRPRLDVNAGAPSVQNLVAKTELTSPMICYELRPDSIATRAALPTRFGLRRGAVRRPNVVLPITANGVVDTPMEGSTWAELPSGVIRVTFAHSTLLIDGQTAHATWNAEAAELEVAHVPCGG